MYSKYKMPNILVPGGVNEVRKTIKKASIRVLKEELESAEEIFMNCDDYDDEDDEYDDEDDDSLDDYEEIEIARMDESVADKLSAGGNVDLQHFRPYFLRCHRQSANCV